MKRLILSVTISLLVGSGASLSVHSYLKNRDETSYHIQDLDDESDALSAEWGRAMVVGDTACAEKLLDRLGEITRERTALSDKVNP